MSRPAILSILALAISAGIALGAPVTRNITFYANKNDYAPPAGGQNYSACWSYIHSDGREYAVIGVNGQTPTTGGTAIYNVTNPATTTLVGFIPGPQSIWHEYKQYRDWIYAVSEGSGTGAGVQIIRMTNPDSPVLAATYTTNFITAHTVSVDTTRGILICNGTAITGVGRGMRVLALNNSGLGATPENPVEMGWWPGGAIPVPDSQYVHDSVPVGNRIYCASIYNGFERVLDFTNPATPTPIKSWTYPGAATHNSWPDASGNYLYVTDELKGQTLKVFDISNLASPALVNGITSNPQAIVHNAHVKGSELYLSNYTEGIRVLDLSDPAHPAEFGWADSYAGPSGGFCGVWEVAPFFPSGTVIASDRNSGLYVYRVQHDYGILRAKVRTGGNPFPGVEVRVTTLGDSLTTPADGIVQFAPGPGTHTVVAHKFGYVDASATRNVTIGSRDTVTLDLVPRPTGPFTGTIRDANTHLPLAEAEVDLAYTDVHQHTGASGLYSMNVPDDTYRLEVRRGGYVPLEIDRRIGPGFPGMDYSLPPAPVWDPLETATAWTIGATGDNAFAGIWVRTTPQGTGPRPPAEPPPAPFASTSARTISPEPARPPAETARASGARGGMPLRAEHEEITAAVLPNMAPYFDHSPGAGTMCFVTGNSADSVNIDAADVDGGKTSLTTPTLDLSGMAEPTIGYWRWFASYFPTGLTIGHNGPDPDDYLAVLISNNNGATWTSVDTTRGLENHWEEQSIQVADYVTPTAQVKVRFVACDGVNATTCEAGIDDLTAYDAATVPVGVPAPGTAARLAFRAPAPNPASGDVRLVLEVARAGAVSVELLDPSGRRVATLFRGDAAAGSLPLAWDGRDAAGREAPAGLYFARANAGGERAFARFVRVR